MIKKIFSSLLASALLVTAAASCDRSHAAENEPASTVSEAVNESPSVSNTEQSTAEESSAETSEPPVKVDVDYKDRFHSFFQVNYATMDIDCIMQREIGLINGCEVVSLSMALDYFGFEIDPRILFHGFMPYGKYGEANPYEKYVGDPRDGSGFGCYAPCVVEAANKFLSHNKSKIRARDVSGSSAFELLSYVWNGVPVILWGTLDMGPSHVYDRWYFDGEYINWYEYSHCVLITGIRNDSFIVCDPLKGETTYPIEDVMRANELIYSQAVVIY